MNSLGTIAMLCALASVQATINAFLVALVVLLVLSPERVDQLRRWVARLHG
ncbi:hypothetical protein RA307_04780 [Xanthobacteraceae bacterium Astr-EGSB]|uniref:hypothetical protein n=1 Tax=Astrobacterium formosum TaxID=3069710 RepID=UPI0027B5AF58|nr:hypothetical protein [Xanthobacteraceae bacterium Astr-EGSB]